MKQITHTILTTNYPSNNLIIHPKFLQRMALDPKGKKDMIYLIIRFANRKKLITTCSQSLTKIYLSYRCKQSVNPKKHNTMEDLKKSTYRKLALAMESLAVHNELEDTFIALQIENFKDPELGEVYTACVDTNRLDVSNLNSKLLEDAAETLLEDPRIKSFYKAHLSVTIMDGRMDHFGLIGIQGDKKIYGQEHQVT